MPRESPSGPRHLHHNPEDLKAALDALIAGEAIAADQTPSLGCNIKWKAE